MNVENPQNFKQKIRQSPQFVKSLRSTQPKQQQNLGQSKMDYAFIPSTKGGGAALKESLHFRELTKMSLFRAYQIVTF